VGGDASVEILLNRRIVMALICLDLDGTVLHEGKPVKGVIESIELLKKNNHEIAIATGRSPLLLNNYDSLLGVDYLVLANGGHVQVKGNIIFERYIPSEYVKRAMEYSDSENIDLVIEYDDKYVAYRKDTDIPDKFCDIFKIDKPDIDRNYYPNRNVFSMIVFDSDKIDDMRKKLPELQFNSSNKFGYDVNLKGDLKADGIRALVDHLGYEMNDVFAIGDGYNDISMIKAVGHGIAMGNASQELKDKAEYITTDVNNYGLMNALKYYSLI